MNCRLCRRRGDHDPSKQNYVSTQLLGPGSVSAQLQCFKDCPVSDLRRYPLAFTELQERAFAGNSERYGESEHKCVKAAMTRGLVVSKPAYTCARKRRPQVERMLKDPVQFEWLVGEWKSRTIFLELLVPKYSRESVMSITTAQRHANIYGYEIKTVHADTTEQQQGILAMTDARDRVQTVPILPVAGTRLFVINFLKNHLRASCVFAVAKHIFDAALDAACLDVAGDEFHEGGLLDALQDRVMDDCPESELTYFLVVDPRPENKFQLRVAQVEKVSSMVDVKVLQTLCVGDPLALTTDGESRRINLACWCSPDYFYELMGSLRMFSSAAGNMQVGLKALCDSGGIAASVPMVPPTSAFSAEPDVVPEPGPDAAELDMMEDALAFLGDGGDDGLGDGGDDGVDDVGAPVAAVVAVAPEAAGAGALVPVDATRSYRPSGLISDNAVPLFKELVEGKYFTENGAVVMAPPCPPDPIALTTGNQQRHDFDIVSCNGSDIVIEMI